MMSFTSRSATALMLVRISVGLGACFNAWPHLHGYTWNHINLHSGMGLMVWLLQFICGGLMVMGLWMPWACIPLLIIAVAPMRWPPQPLPIFASLLPLASAIGGPGKWAIGKG